MPRFDFTYSVRWNLLLLTTGAVLFSWGIKTIALYHGFITGGLFGTGLLLHYAVPALSAGVWFLLLNVPLFVMGWLWVSKRFFWYSLYCMLVITAAYELIPPDMHFHDQLYAAVAAGVVTGAGAGVILRSLGSAGGLDILAIILNQRYNLGIGRFYFLFNAVLFSFSFASLDNDLVIASLILVFISSVVVEYVLALFNGRKVVFVISDHSEAIVKEIMESLRLGATFLKGQGAYTGQEKDVLMTITNNIQLKRLEEIVFTIDPRAVFIVENTLNVIGSSFSRRKIY
jgi:uncharacterized membrane-anchored protein YitT (DUF2179 family)